MYQLVSPYPQFQEYHLNNIGICEVNEFPWFQSSSRTTLAESSETMIEQRNTTNQHFQLHKLQM